jgi:Cdc6-like AAA superfamily ATPase
MQQIPDEIVQLILSFSTCSLNEYATISLVSKQFHTTVTSDLFWKPLWTNLYPHSENYVRDDFYATYISTRRQQCEDPLFYAYNKKQGRLNDIKLIVLGADGVGKSTLTVQYVNGVFITEYDPTMFVFNLNTNNK